MGQLTLHHTTPHVMSHEITLQYATLRHVKSQHHTTPQHHTTEEAQKSLPYQMPI